MTAALDPRWGLFPNSPTGAAAGATGDHLGRAAATVLDSLVEAIATRAAELVVERMSATPDKPSLLTKREAADELGVDVKTVGCFIKSGQLETCTIESGRQWISRAALDRFLGAA